MTHKQELLKKINSFSAILLKTSQWHSSGKPFGHIDYKKTKEKNYIFEFYCYLKVLKDLKKNYSIEYMKAPELFPKAPGNKKNKSKFVIRNSKNEYQVCAGTEIRVSNIDSYPIAPDISFQTANSSDEPNENDVVLIMDAKYKSNPRDNVLTNDELKVFSVNVADLKVKSASTESIEFDRFKDLLNNCLLTNGKSLSDKIDFCIKKNMVQIEAFDIK